MTSGRRESEHVGALPPELRAKANFLASPAAHGGGVAAVETIETHMSLVFLAGDRAYKLKKPVRLPYLDFSTLSAREANCRAELRLNRRLAPGAYLRVAALTRAPGGEWAIDGEGEIVDWLVVMRRLPAERMLDVLLAAGKLDAAAVDKLVARLAAFYHDAERPPIAPADYYRRLVEEQEFNRRVIEDRRFVIDHPRAAETLDRLDAALRAERPRLEARAAGGFLVDGHGDLRPEHVCFENGVLIFDCLEFNEALRCVDPIDEIANLAMECARLGAHWLGPKLLAGVLAALRWTPSPALYPLHAARRATLRARLSLAHLFDPAPRKPKAWEPQAAQYLALAQASLDAREAAARLAG